MTAERLGVLGAVTWIMIAAGHFGIADLIGTRVPNTLSSFAPGPTGATSRPSAPRS